MLLVTKWFVRTLVGLSLLSFGVVHGNAGDEEQRRGLEDTCSSFLLQRQVILELQGTPSQFTQESHRLLQDTFVRTYNVLAASECADSIGSRGLFDATFADYDFSNDDSSEDRVFALQASVSLFCFGCLQDDTLFRDSTAVSQQQEGECVCEGPTVRTFKKDFKDLIDSMVASQSLEGVTSFYQVSELETVDCPASRSDFNASVVLDLAGQNAAAGAEQNAQALEAAVLRSLLNLFAGNTQVCDPYFRRITSIRMYPTFDLNRRLREQRRSLLQDDNENSSSSAVPSGIPSESLAPSESIAPSSSSGPEQNLSPAPTSAPTAFDMSIITGVFDIASVMVEITGDCRGCESGTFLSNDISGRRRRFLETTAAISSSSGRLLTEDTSTDECVCPVNSERRGPTGSEVSQQLGAEVQTDPELDFIDRVLEAFEIREQNCLRDVTVYYGYVTVNLFMGQVERERRTRLFLQEAIAQAYNEVAARYCDPLFRTIETESTVLLEKTPVEGADPESDIGEYELLYRVNVRTRGGNDDDGIFDSAGRRLSTSEEGGGRRLEIGEHCFCPVDSAGDSAPSKEVFLIAFRRIVGDAINRGFLEGVYLALPSPSSIPSASPTLEPTSFTTQAIEFNDDCNTARTMRVGSSFSGSTVEAGFDDDHGECGVLEIVNTAPGVWYRYRGEGNPVIVSTCDSDTRFDTQITVFSGTCRSLTCVDANDNSCGSQSMVSWIAEIGETYYILVHGNAFATGDFVMSLREGLENDLCENAIRLPMDGSSTSGTTVGATTDSMEMCGDLVFNTGPGVWYEVIGTGDPMIVSTCDPETDFDTQISVFGGDDCGELLCVDGNDQSCGDQSLVAWMTTPGLKYKILVHGFRSASGNFTLTFDPDGLDNDVCENATNLQALDSEHGEVTATTVGATFDNVGGCGLDVANTGPGLWYRVVGNGEPMIVDACNPTTSFDIQISVFRNGCGATLECIDGNDNHCGSQSQVAWLTNAGEQYHVLVHGFEQETGNFTLQLRPGIENDVCLKAINMTTLPTESSLVFGSTDGATFDDVGLCGQEVVNTGPGVWYSVRGFGSPITASTCIDSENTDTNFDTMISVFEGSCDAMFCVDGDDNGCEMQSVVEFFAEEGRTYFILVHGNLLEYGEFGLAISVAALPSESPSSAPSVPVTGVPSSSPSAVPTAVPSEQPSELPSLTPSSLPSALPSLAPSDAPSSGPTMAPLANDLCGGAFALPRATSTVEGTTVRGTLDGVPVCGGVPDTGPGVWYSADGTGGPMIVSTCGGATNFNTRISVFTGSCERFECVGGNELHCGLGSQVAWFSSSFDRYFILIHGVEEQEGDFSLTIDYEGIENDLCQNAIALADTVAAATVNSGTTIGATLDGLADCETNGAISSPGVWFTIQGIGSTISLSTCEAGNIFGAQISVFYGSCGSLACVTDSIYSTCGAQSSVSFFGTDGEMYYILVHGRFASEIGLFELRSTISAFPSATPSSSPSDTPSLSPSSQPSLPPNDLCINAYLVPNENFYTLGSTVGFTNDGVGSCGNYINQAAGVWYYLNGDGNTYSFSTCGSDTTYDTQIFAYSGSCTSFSSIACNDDACGLSSSVAFQTEAGTDYFVLVHGFYTSEGDFGLTVTNFGVASNDLCADAEEIPSGGAFVLGATIGQTVDASPTCSGVIHTSASIWYTMTADDAGAYAASTIHAETNYYTAITVYTGNCEQLSCVAADSGRCSGPNSGSLCERGSFVVFPTETGQTYLISVHGNTQQSYFTGEGTFGLSVEPYVTPDNDFCAGAIAIPSDSSVMTGNTLLGTYDGLPLCLYTDGYSTAPGLWYTVTGDGNLFHVSTCHSATTYYPEVSVFPAGSCGALSCEQSLEYSRVSCFGGAGRAFQFGTTLGTSYYVLVHGYGSSAGQFGISVESIEYPANDLCAGASTLLTDGSVILGNTVPANYDSAAQGCGYYDYYDGPGLFYELTGDGGIITVSTCDDNTEFSTYLSIFTGDCSNLDCLTTNYDGGCERGSTVTFTSVYLMTYYVLVHSSWEAGKFGVFATSTPQPSSTPSSSPSTSPSVSPSDAPTKIPSVSPSDAPSTSPSDVPSLSPSHGPSDIPSATPTVTHSQFPSHRPSDIPSKSPSSQPSDIPSKPPSSQPSDIPSKPPSSQPSKSPSSQPSDIPSKPPSFQPSDTPSLSPSDTPSNRPSPTPFEDRRHRRV